MTRDSIIQKEGGGRGAENDNSNWEIKTSGNREPWKKCATDTWARLLIPKELIPTQYEKNKHRRSGCKFYLQI
jgi:hypothetical protein